MSAMLLAGCKIDSAAPADSSATALGKKTCLNGTQPKGNSCQTSTTTTPTPTPATAVTETPTTGIAVATPNGLAGELDIADNFDTSTWLIPGEAPVASPDEVGAFRFTCLSGQLSHDDPLVYPGQPGKSHLHQFFGNTATNASSTYQSLRTTGGSTCTRSTDVSPQRSAYWMPAMLDGAGNAVKPDWTNTYYKEFPASDPACTTTVDPTNPAIAGPSIGKCVAMPNGLRFIVGYNMFTGTGGPADTGSRDYWAMGWDCMTSDGTNVSLTGVQHSIAAILATGRCPIGAWLRSFVTYPQCWDGHNLDSADHRSHIVMPPQAICPSDHPYRIPEIAFGAYFRTDANFEAGKWHLSSDEMVAGTVAGTTLHMDYWEAWSPTFKALWTTNCIDGHLTCSTGNVGDGREIRGMQQIGAVPNHVLVPLTSIP